MKKIIALIITSILLLLNSLTVFASETPCFELSNAEGQVNETVTIQLSISNNPGITAFGLEISYPTDNFELIDVNANGVYESGFSKSKIDSNPFRISWHDLDSKDICENGTVASFSFKIKSLNESAQISLSYDENDVFNSSFVNQHFDIANSTIKLHNHVFDGGTITTEPTCTEKGIKTFACSCGYSYTEDVNAIGHSEVIDKAVAPTCTKTGLTAGSHCSKCNVVFTAQTIIPSLGHTEVKDEAIAPTCTKTGLTEGSHCSVCGETIVAQKTVKAKGHNPAAAVKENIKPATYSTVGTYDNVVYCSTCGAEISRTKVTVPKLAKKANPMLAKGKSVTVKFKNLKKKNQTVAQKNAFSVTKAQGKVTYTKASGNKSITVSSAGKITVKKGLKKGTYKVKVKAKAAGNATYKAKTVTITVTIKVK